MSTDRESSPLLSASGLSRRLGERTLWQDVQLEVYPGESVAVVGPSGSGKSLLLRALAGLDPLQGGTVTFRGRAQQAWPMPQYRAQVTYLPQRAAVYPGTVQTNLRTPFGLKVRAGAVYDPAAAETLLRALGRTPDFLALDAATLSGGEGQVLALTRTLLTAPAVLLLDEATASLDPDAAGLAEEVLRAWLHAAPERALVWVSHDAAQRERVSTRALPLVAP